MRPRAKAADAGVDLDLRLGDMRDLELDELFALIYCPGRSLLHVRTWAERRQVFERVARSLRPSGSFAWNAFAFDHRAATQLDGHQQTSPASHVSHYDVADNRIDMVLDGGATTSLWWATKNEWLGLIDVAGLDVETLHGTFEESELDSESCEYVLVARRPRALRALDMRYDEVRDIVGLYRRVWAHTDATIDALELDSPGYVPWWQEDVPLFNIMVHCLSDTTRHVGHADILREELDGSVGFESGALPGHGRDASFREDRRATIERAARSAGVGQPGAGRQRT